MNNPQIENAKTSIDEFELPCGYLDAEGNLLTSVGVKEMTGDEEEILAAKNMPVMKKFNKILASCTTSIGEISDPKMIERIVSELTQGDRVYLLFAIRRVSLGNEFPFTAKCPECSQESHLTIDLGDLDIKRMPDPKIRTYQLKLPKSGKTVVMKVLTGKGEEAMSKASNTGKDLISTAMLARVDSIEGRPASLPDLKSLSLTDRNFIRNSWDDHEGGVDTTVQIQCAQCEHEFEADVDIASQGFFNPLAVSKTWKTK